MKVDWSCLVTWLIVLAFLIAFWAFVGYGLDSATGTDEPPVETVDRTVEGMNVDEWAHQANRWHTVAARYLNHERNLAHAIHFDPEVSTAINLACTVYGHCHELWRKARCESKLHRFARNHRSNAKGVLQFLASTWRSTPYRRFSPYDPYANALAAGWMHRVGRGGEWVCQ